MYQSEKVTSMVDQLSRLNPYYGREDLPDPSRPDDKPIPRELSSLEQVPHMQKQLDILSYNHLPHTIFNLEKHRSLHSILMTGKEALAEALPIRCLEATFVGMHLTQENRDLDRIPLSFRSTVGGNHYQHIVLVLHVRQPASLFGALGLSRKRTLMYKPMTYTNLYDLIMDFKREYEALSHELIDVKLGLAITHDPLSRLAPCWRFVALKLAAYGLSPATQPQPEEEALAGSLRRPPSRASIPSPSQPAVLPSPWDSGDTPFTGANNSGRSQWRSCGTEVASVSSQPEQPLSHSSRHHHHHPPVYPSEPIHNGGSPNAPLELSSDGPVCSPVVAAPPADTCAEAARAPNGGGPAPRRQASFAAEFAAQSGGGREALPLLAQFLAKFARLLPVMTEQYYKGLPVVDHSNRNAKLCFLSLEEAERDAKMENNRRIELVGKLQSPLSLEARKIAANRQLKSERGKKRGRSQPRSAVKGGASTSTSVPSSAPASAKRLGATQKAPLPGSSRAVRPLGGPGATAAQPLPSATNETPAGYVVCASSPSASPSPLGGASPQPCGNLSAALRGVPPSSLSLPSLPPTPRNGSSLLSSLSGSFLSSSSDEGFLMDTSRGEGGS